MRQYSGHTDNILALKTIDQNKFVSGGIDLSLYIWSLDQEDPLLKQDDPHNGFIYSIE